MSGQGVGTAIIALAIEKSRSLHASVLTAETAADNAAALSVLHRAGFALDRPRDQRVRASLRL
jgi:RimJ/RimL family protein N-acetyltransferase